ncbi:MAG: hypothetical protein ACRDJI_05795 [Actinomycetota bacterium]
MASPKRIRSLVVASALAAGLLVPAPAGGVALPFRAAEEGRWSGAWEVEGQTQENGDFVLFGIITFELLTGDVADAVRSNFEGTCQDTDDVYEMSWEFGGGGAGEACEIGSLGDHLFGHYYGNDGGWGQFENTYEGGPEYAWRGEYTPPSFNPTFPSDLELLWRARADAQCSIAALARMATGFSCGEDTVSFIFTQGGLPKKHSRGLEDVRTVGQGKITFFNPDRANHDLQEFEVLARSGRVTRELEYVRDEDKMEFRVTGEKFTFVRLEMIGNTSIELDLVVVGSNDALCRKKTKDGPRTAVLGLVDGLDSTADVVELEVKGCPHHNYTFIGKKRVTVAIVHTTPS